MDQAERQPPPRSYTGHVANGVIVLDAEVRLAEGQAVRVEPMCAAPVDVERSERVRQLKQLFAQWTEEDGELPGDVADQLRIGLASNRGLRFRHPDVE
jgi:hypothetical protein